MRLSLLLVALVLVSGCSSMRKTDVVTQGSMINALLAGQYDGTFTDRDVSGWGDLGIGTFDRLDGEMIMLDGRVYQANAKSEVRVMTRYRAPFATMKKFKPDGVFSVHAKLTLEELKSAVDAHLADRNHVYAIRVKGRFSAVSVRSVPPQQKPYPPLTEVVKTQPVFERKDISGVLVGFFVPQYAQGMNVAGYHFHFLSDARDFGGHVLALEIVSGDVALDRADEWRIILPDDEAFASWHGEGEGDAAIKAVESRK
jgi:acetolactate decarboxylase